MAATLSSYTWKQQEWDQLTALIATVVDNCENVRPHACAAKAHSKNPDLPTYAEAMSGEHAEQYWIAMQKEIANLVKRKVWEVGPRSSLPPGTRMVVTGTWSLVIGLIFNLESKAVDFSNAFAQAELPADKPVYAELPGNFIDKNGNDSVLKMKHSYGSFFASTLWVKQLSEGL